MKYLLRYVNEYGFFYQKQGSNPKFETHFDAAWGNFETTRRSTNGIISYVGNHVVDWSSNRQTLVVAHTTTKAEYIADDSSTLTLTVVWLRILLHDLVMKQTSPSFCTRTTLRVFFLP